MLLGAQLRRLRESAGITRDDAGYHIRASGSKISRLELGRVSFKERDVIDLLELYGVVDSAERDKLIQLTKEANAVPWYQKFQDVVPDWFHVYVGLEEAAQLIRVYEVQFVPGLLQTEGYARQIIDSYDRVEPIAPSQVTRLVRVRLRRQQVLDRIGLKISVVLDESVLLRRIGTDLVMYDQLQRLARECERPNMTLQILPLDAQHTVIGESFVLFGFEADGDAVLQDVVSTEQMRSGFILEGERETHLHRVAFRTLTEAALSPADSRKLILETAESRWSVAQADASRATAS